MQEVKKLGLKASNQDKAKNIRGHGYIISFELPNLPNWKHREDILKKKNIDYLPLKPSFKGFRIIIEDHKIWLSENSIVIYTPKHKSYFSNKAKNSHRYAIYDLKRILHNVEGIFNMSFKFNNYYKFKLSRQHYAHIKNELAEQYNRNNEKLQIKQDGKTWLLVDKSFTDELETIDPVKAISDSDNVVEPFFNSLRSNPGYTPDFVMKTLGKIVEDRSMYAADIAAHVAAIKELGEQSKKQTKILNKLLDKLK